MSKKETYFTKKQLEVLELLKEHEIIEAAKELGIDRTVIDNRLVRIRDIIDRAQSTVNIANAYRTNKRLRKLLLRQE